MSRSSRKALILTAAAAAGLVHAHIAAAATHTWTGASDNSWNNASNWTSNAVPNSTSDDVFFATPGALNLNIVANTGAAGFSVRTLTFNTNVGSTPVTLTVDSTHTLTVQGTTGDDITVLAGAQKIQGSNTGTELKLNSTDFNIADGASLELAARLGAGASSNSYSKGGGGTLILSASNGGSGGWNFTGGTFNVNGGVLEMKSTSAYGNSGDRWTVNNSGVLQLDSNYGSVQGGIVLNSGATLRTSGNFTVPCGTYNSGGNPGTIALGSGSANLSTLSSTNTLTVQRAFSGAGGINKIGGGTVVLDQGRTDGSTGASQFPGGFFPQNTFTGNTTVSEGTLKLNANASLATSPLINVLAGAAFNVTPNAAYAVASNQTLGGNGTVYGAVTMSNPGSTLAPGLVGTVGVLTLGDASTASPLTLNGGRVHFDLSNTATTPGANDLLAINGDLNLSGPTRVAINRLNTGLQSNSTYTLMTFTGALNGSASNLVLPIVRQGLSIIDPTTTPGQIQLSVGSGSAANLVWVGDGSANLWNANGATNWSGAADQKYFDWDNVTFDDTGSNNPNVTINDTLVPNSITLNNTAKAYTFGGTGTLTNVNSVVKNGGAAATFNNSGVNLFNTLTVNAGTLNLANDNVGAGTINSGGALTVLNAATFTTLSINAGGTLTVGDGATTGAGSISGSITNNGTFVFNRPDDFAVSSVLSGSGAIVKNGTGVATFSGNSSYTGPTYVNAGTIKPVGSTALGVTTGGGSVIISSGAAIDLSNAGATNTVNFGDKVFHIQGTGVGGAGAITNSGTTSQFSAFNNITLDNDALIGGFRMDIGRNLPGQLDLGGHKLTLNMTGNSATTPQPMFGIEANVTITAGTIELTSGAIDFERTATVHSDGAGSNIIFDSNTIAQFFETTAGSISRPLVFMGGNFIGPGSNNGAIVDSPLQLRGNVTFQTISSGVVNTNGTGTFTVNGPITESGGSFGVTKVNNNQVTLNGTNTYSGGTTVNAGTLLTNTNLGNGTLTMNGGVARVAAQATTNSKTGLTVVPAVQVNGGSVDLTNNAMVVDYTPGNSPLTTIRGYIASGYNGGAWTGSGIASSSAAASPAGAGKTALGYGEASALGITSVAGVPVDNSSIVVKYALAGDANLDGTVNALDFNAVATNFGAGSNLWRQGDFNYDGNVDASDFTAMSQNFGGVLASAPLATSLGSVVPEPASFGLLALGACMLSARRRRK